MGRENHDPRSLYGIVFTVALVVLPTVWSAAVKSQMVTSAEDVSAGKAGPGANPVKHEIPTNPSEVDLWFHKVALPVRDRPDVEPDLVTAEDKMEIIRVRKDGTGKFKTVMEAVNAVEEKGNDNRVIIDIGPGVYKEQVKIDKYRPYITLYACPKQRATITFDADVPKYEMTDTPVLSVEGDYFNAINVVIINNAPKKEGQHPVAVRVTGNYATFYNVIMSSKVNTLLDDTGKHFFKDCLIEGGNDVIFGDGRSIYLNTTINLLPNLPASIITAQARKNTDPNGGGFVFVYCTVMGETSVKALLGRTFNAGSRVIFAYSELSGIVQPQGWFDAFDTDYEKTAFFGEYKNKGIGSILDKRIDLPCTKKVTDADVKPFLNLDFIDGAEWLLPPVVLKADLGKH